MELNKYYCVSGYGWSGSGAIVDLLKEFKGFKALNCEYPLISEPNGIIDLEIFLIQNWHFLRHDMAIRDFIAFSSKLDKKYNRINTSGIDISKKLSVDFNSEISRFIRQILDFSYNGRSRIHLYRLNLVKLLFKKIYGKLINRKYTKMYFSKPTEEHFISEVQKFHDNIFRNYFSQGFNSIILDQAIPVNHAVRAQRYFRNCKLIIVDRDPRDIYADLVKKNALIGPELSKPTISSVEKYIHWHNVHRNNSISSYSPSLANNILQINFEDIVLSYEDSLIQIKKFIGSDIIHEFPRKYFKPNISKNNVGLWKQLPNQEMIDIIKSNINYKYRD